eukprot:923885-Pyramimonas_sp.AAC.2
MPIGCAQRVAWVCSLGVPLGCSVYAAQVFQVLLARLLGCAAWVCRLGALGMLPAEQGPPPQCCPGSPPDGWQCRHAAPAAGCRSRAPSLHAGRFAAPVVTPPSAPPSGPARCRTTPAPAPHTKTVRIG